MYARRLAPAMALLLALMPASDAIAGDAGRAPSRAAEPPATRADVLAGRATQDQALDLLKTSIERAGGTTVDDSIAPESTPPPEPLGGYVYPLLASDLDGDGDDEVVLEQWSDTDHVLAVDDRGILWREALPDGTFLVGAFVADLIEGGAEELLLVAYRYEVPGLGFLAAAGADGFVWSAEIPTNYLEINGLVQADADALPEVAVTGWDVGWESTL